MLWQYGVVAAILAVAAAFVFGSLLASSLVRPKRPSQVKNDSYECGEEAVGSAWFNFNPRFYLIALIFVIFDVEVVFLFPVVTVFRRWVDQQLGWQALAEIMLFLAVLLVGLVYAWRKGDLTWHVATRDDSRSGRVARSFPGAS